MALSESVPPNIACAKHRFLPIRRQRFLAVKGDLRGSAPAHVPLDRGYIEWTTFLCAYDFILGLFSLLLVQARAEKRKFTYLFRPRRERFFGAT